MTTMTNITEETTALILSGHGYQLTIAPEAEVRKQELLSIAKAVCHVRDNDESAQAQYHSRSLAAMRIEVEKCRKIVKEPVNRIGKMIDQSAKDFILEIEAEEKRITRLVGDHAEEVARIKRIKEAEERAAFEAARIAREAAAEALYAAEQSSRMADVIAAKQAERERQEALAARMAASAGVAETKVAEGVRFAWDFEVLDIHTLYLRDRTLIDMVPKRAAILALIKGCEESGRDAADVFAALGIRAFKKPVVSSR